MDVVKAAASGSEAEACTALARMRNDRMRNWYDVHGQNTGAHRVRTLNLPMPAPPSLALDPIKRPTALEKRVFERDGYRCRYCGLRVVPKAVFEFIQRFVGRDRFCSWGSNPVMHGAAHAFRAYADHVVPHSLAGRTNMENLVTACPACNSGKYDKTLEQLGLDDPRSREPQLTGWDGLVSIVANARAAAKP